MRTVHLRTIGSFLLLAACGTKEPAGADDTDASDTDVVDTDVDDTDVVDTDVAGLSLDDCLDALAPCAVAPGVVLTGTAPVDGEYFLVFDFPDGEAHTASLQTADTNAAINNSDPQDWTYLCAIDGTPPPCCLGTCTLDLLDWSGVAGVQPAGGFDAGVHVYTPAGGPLTITFD